MVVSDELSAGTLVGAYRIVHLLGRGGMGAVYAAEQVSDGRLVALKLLSNGLGSPDDHVRFLREGQIAASINHPNTVYVYGTSEIDGQPVIVMELVEGGTLEETVANRGPLPITEAIDDILQVIDGLEAAQRLGILHRDVKPANCFVAPDGVVKVGDFGLSRPVDQVAEARLTQSGLFLGTPVFSSPEQLTGEALDVRSDIYAVGATLYFLLSGQLPFRSDNAVRLIAAVLAGSATPLREYRGDVPRALNSVVMRCLTRDRDQRPSDYAELRRELRACRPDGRNPAPLAVRANAWVADAAMAFFVFILFTGPIAAFLRRDLLPAVTTVVAVAPAALIVALTLALIGVLEGLIGFGPGTWLTGTRLVRRDGTRAGPVRGALRALLSGASLVTLIFAVEADRSDMLPVLAMALAVAPFMRARRANGFLTESDRLTDTEVVKAPLKERAPHAGSQIADVRTLATEPLERIGPYEVVGRMPTARDVIEGYDSSLRRRVWILEHASATSLPNLIRTEGARRGTLRWVGGQRTATGAWDAFAAVPGNSLREGLASPTTWREVHGWLTDVTDELVARRDRNYPPFPTSLHHVWISETGSAVLLPFPADVPDPVLEPDASLLASIAIAVRRVNRDWPERETWPASAQLLLNQLAAEEYDLDDAREKLRAMSDRLAPMTMRRRLGLWILCGGPVVALALATTATSNFNSTSLRQRLERNVANLNPLIEFIHMSPQSGSVERQRVLVGAYIAANFRELITGRMNDPQISDAIPDPHWRLADSVLVANVDISPALLREAESLVRRDWRGRPPKDRDVSLGWLFVYAAIPLMMLLAFLAHIATALFGRGLAVRLLALAVITHRGDRCGRARALWRQAVVWSWLWILIGCATALAIRDRSSEAVGFWPSFFSVGAAGARAMFRASDRWIFVLPILLIVGSIALVIRTPSRGLAERLSGTRLVPE